MIHPNNIYHIYNHANGRDNLFEEERNYHFFLEKYEIHVAPVVDTWAYCLMPNHFHLLVKIKPEEELALHPSFPKFETSEKMVSKQFANFFSSYTQAFNKLYNRRGSLFLKNFKRKEITSEKYLKEVILYIHANAVHHGFADNIEDWPHSSYMDVLDGRDDLISSQRLINQFDSRENFIFCHSNKLKNIEKALPNLEYSKK